MRFLLLNQTFHPDVMATGQYLTEVALRLVERGHQVTVLTSRRAYDHPEQRFPKDETWRGIRILRVGSSGLGKAAKWRRGMDFASFIAFCCLRLAFLPRADVVVALTSPPLISFVGAWLAKLRRSRFVYWVMDLNPDEAIAAGWLREGSRLARVLHRMSRFSLERATRVIALDRFMQQRIAAKGIAPEKIKVIPPWSHDDEIHFDAAGREAFRKAHGLESKFVVMYSGNHSPCHPLDTLLRAAERLAHDPQTVFCFVGGGSEWRRIAQGAGRKAQGAGQTPSTFNPQPSTILCLPYQPLSALAGSLSAADLHVVVMGEPFVGVVHPCKIYNILSVGAPFLYIGPQPSHVTEILRSADWGVCLRHGDVDGVVREIGRARREQAGRDGLPQGLAGEPNSRAPFGKEVLLPKLVAELEAAGEELPGGPDDSKAGRHANLAAPRTGAPRH